MISHGILELTINLPLVSLLPKREGFKSIINGFPKNAMKLHFDKIFCPVFSKTGGVLGRSPKVLNKFNVVIEAFLNYN